MPKFVSSTQDVIGQNESRVRSLLSSNFIDSIVDTCQSHKALSIFLSLTLSIFLSYARWRQREVREKGGAVSTLHTLFT